MSTTPPPLTGAADAIRRYWPMIYLPTALFSTGEGAIVPILPTIAIHLGAPIEGAALIAAALIIGQLCGNLPAGALVARVGERIAMIIAAGVALVGAAAMFFAPHLVVLALSALLVGLCASVFAIARHVFMTTHVPLSHRARAISLVGGSARLGALTGPLVASGLIWLTGSEHSTILFLGVCLVAVGLVVAFGPDPEQKALEAERGATGAMLVDTGKAVTGPIPVRRGSGLFQAMRAHGAVLLRLGTAGATLSAVRAGRDAVLPLWGVSIGLDSATISLIVGIAGAAEFSLFYASGQIMDRFGRVWATVPPLLLMGTAFVLLSFTHDLYSAGVWFVALAVVIGLGNGMSSGALMTVGSDLAPPESTAQFLGAWRTITDAGGASAPLIVSALAAVATLAVGTGVIGAFGILGAAAFVRWLPRYIPKPSRRK